MARHGYINEKNNEGGVNTNEQPTAPTATEIKEIEPSEKSDSLDNNIIVPADTSSISVDSLLITAPLLEPETPSLLDSVKAPSIEMPPDSTK